VKLWLDGVEFPVISAVEIPAGVLNVPVKVLDGEDRVWATSLIAGSIGVTVSEEGSTFQSRSGWWMVEDTKMEVEVEERDEREENERKCRILGLQLPYTEGPVRVRRIRSSHPMETRQRTKLRSDRSLIRLANDDSPPWGFEQGDC